MSSALTRETTVVFDDNSDTGIILRYDHVTRKSTKCADASKVSISQETSPTQPYSIEF